jgi:hypothetical protein
LPWRLIVFLDKDLIEWHEVVAYVTIHA